MEAITAPLGQFYAGLGPMAPLLVMLIVMDVLTGLVSAWVNRRLSSKVSRAGMGRKLLELAAVILAQLLEAATGVGALSDMAAGFYVITEAISILENLADAGVPVPPQLRAALASLREKPAVPGVPVVPVAPVAPAVPLPPGLPLPPADGPQVRP